MYLALRTIVPAPRLTAAEAGEAPRVGSLRNGPAEYSFLNRCLDMHEQENIKARRRAARTARRLADQLLSAEERERMMRVAAELDAEADALERGSASDTSKAMPVRTPDQTATDKNNGNDGGNSNKS